MILKRLFFQVLFFGAILFSVLFFSWTVFSCDYLGPTDIVADEAADVLYILERDARQIRKIHAEKETYPEILQLPVIPERMRWFPDQQHLAIVGGSSQGHLLIVDIKSFKMTADIPVGHSPSDVAVFQSREQTMIYVANRFDGTISVVEQNKETKCFEAGREPIALTVTPDGQTLIIAGHLPEDSSLNFDISSRIRFIDTQTGKATPIRLDSGAMNLRDLLLSPEGRYVFVTGNIGHFQQMPNSVTGGWMNENILFVADIVRRRVVTSYRLDDYAIGSANPWGLSLSGDGRFLVLAAAGSGDILLINRIKLIKLLEDDSVQKIESITSTTPLDALLPTRMRIPVGLKGVRHAVMSKDRIFATAYFEDAVAKIVPHFSEPFDFVAGILPHDNIVIPRKQIFPLDSVTPIPNHRSKMNKDETDTINKSFRFVPLSPFVIAPGIRFERSFARLGAEPVWTDIRYGEMLFHDAHLCQEHWQSCATCHPDARSDTLNWDLLNDGPDNPKNTKSLLFSHETPPSMAHGVRDRAETAVRKGFATILMLPVTEREAEAVDAYLSHLQPVPSPHLVAGQRSESAKRGRRIFDRSGCSLCHPEPLFTDGRKHNVGTRSPIDSSPLFDTPTLREVWRTAPYLHDGRYKTIRELITDGKHVNTDQRLDQLTNEEINDLIEYILSL